MVSYLLVWEPGIVEDEDLPVLPPPRPVGVEDRVVDHVCVPLNFLLAAWAAVNGVDRCLLLARLGDVQVIVHVLVQEE
eukprot:CAMPEP_0202908912 /NCGR_PEP_ID=MMETSP1392-20130828/47584_1 /ASSEMBLY_ACC=CAM_ASM_000868 /TAXON_ID=225041 /ORGANISM="Chlamydomonas chlamydogama, Strain SAG 11-48b" /LENGTH=77 /DNA_ID=CAMNT_0049598451 /DNA_START=506 /DNA_END=738 /DNA_ORIENTATION=-